MLEKFCFVFSLFSSQAALRRVIENFYVLNFTFPRVHVHTAHIESAHYYILHTTRTHPGAHHNLNPQKMGIFSAFFSFFTARLHRLPTDTRLDHGTGPACLSG